MSSLAFNGPKRGKVSAARLIDRPMCLAVRSFIHSFIHSVLLPPLHWIRQRPFTIVARGQKENRSQATERKKKTKESKSVCCEHRLAVAVPRTCAPLAGVAYIYECRNRIQTGSMDLWSPLPRLLSSLGRRSRAGVLWSSAHPYIRLLL